MIASYRRDFNARFTPEKYQRYLSELERRSGAPVKFRCCETPCFFPLDLLEGMAQAGSELVHQLVSNGEYLEAADRMIPEPFRVQHATDRPLFVQADFGIIRDSDGAWRPRLVEIQAFPSLYGLQLTMTDAYREAYDLPSELQTLLGNLSRESYDELLRNAILGGHDPESVVLLEIDPAEQKTMPDFLVTEQICGIRTVNIRDVRQAGRELYREEQGRKWPIRRIYNRAIVDELVRKQIRLQFDLAGDLDVEWAGHPSWFFRISKFSLPWLHHETVPQCWFLSDVTELPLSPEQLVLKPLFSFAGLGVTIGPTEAEVRAIPEAQRGEYILQERVHFEPVIDTPPGMAKAEVRVMYIWTDRLQPVTTIVRMGRGKMMGVDQNRDLDWVGASAGLYPT